MKKLIFLTLFLFTLPAQAALYTLNWTAPTEYENGYPLDYGDISYYKIYYKTRISSNYKLLSRTTNNQNTFLFNLPKGQRYYFVVTAVDLFGFESQYSNQVIK